MNLNKYVVSAHDEELMCQALRFECPKYEAVQCQTMTELITNCTEYHKDIEFGLRSIIVSIIIILT